LTEVHLFEQATEFIGDLCGWVAGEGRRNQALRLAQGAAFDGQGRGAAVADGSGRLQGKVGGDKVRRRGSQSKASRRRSRPHMAVAWRK